VNLFERVFEELLQRNYYHHDRIQQSEDKKLQHKSRELNQIDEQAKAFEKNMELAAYEIEQWLINHQKKK
jgi:hypothetical protein